MDLDRHLNTFIARWEPEPEDLSRSFRRELKILMHHHAKICLQQKREIDINTGRMLADDTRT